MLPKSQWAGLVATVLLLGTASQAVEPMVPLPEPTPPLEKIPEVSLEDPPYDRYVDLSLLGQAWDNQDVELLIDVALQLAEGERVLMRPHKAVAADAILVLAVRLATQKRDEAGLDRLTVAATRLKKNTLVTLLSAAKAQLGERPRAINPALLVPVGEISPASVAAFQGVVETARAAQVIGDVAVLKAQRAYLDDLAGLPPAQRDHLRKLIDEAIATIPKDQADTNTARVLEQLSGERSRGWVQKASGGRITTPEAIQKIAPRGISYTPRPPNESKLAVEPNSAYPISIVNQTSYRVVFDLYGDRDETPQRRSINPGTTGNYSVTSVRDGFVRIDQPGSKTGFLEIGFGGNSSFSFQVEKATGKIKLYKR